ncbi:FAD-dependent oxidoreductase [Bacillus sp. es.034]|uniref:dihydrolipoyl dehydrogenase family protein n=1 Tax=Bacillus sp. es.034 TaxID=1761763 RepID=UPI000BF3C503|nr:FAD-dependent oxidoreductase [Bacillus sp. es.034]PFG03750.1 dihydrolipoamide dehydrogenase [Bacillus sp. es.034]
MVVGEITEEKDVIVIGGGPGGYHAAIRAAGLGRQVTLIEREDLGGTCLNKGCIPSKVFTHFAQEFKKTKHLKEMGMEFGEVEANLATLQHYKNKKINQLRTGVESLCKANKVEIIKGTASFLSESRIGVENGHEFSLFNFKEAIVATGGDFHYPDEIIFNDDTVLKERQVFELEEIPRELIMYGADYISLEIASVFCILGSQVTLILSEELAMDNALSKELSRQLKKQKISVVKQCVLTKACERDGHVIAELEKEDGETVSIEGSHFVVSGRVKPNLSDLGLDRLRIETTVEGYIQTDPEGRTSIPHIWAIGDVTEGPSLAVKAIKQGKAAAEAMAGLPVEVDLRFVPTVVQMIPPIAYAGLTEEEAQREGYYVTVSENPVRGNGYAQLTEEKDGFVKVVSDSETDVILGIHMMGMGVVELITAGVMGLEMAARDEDFRFPLYPHPSMNETMLEAVEGLKGDAVHMPPRKKEPVR